MPIFDKVKAQATQLAQKAQEAGKAGQSKLEDVQARRRADGLLRDLGAATYAERSGRATEDTKAQIERLMGELSAYEAEHGSLSASGTGEPAEKGASSESEPAPEGGFTL